MSSCDSAHVGRHFFANQTPLGVIFAQISTDFYQIKTFVYALAAPVPPPPMPLPTPFMI